MDPVTEALTEAVSSNVRWLMVPNAEALASQTMVSAERFVDAMVIVKVKTNFPVVGAVASIAAALSTGF